MTNINRVELLPNASKFAVFCAIRSIVIEFESKSQTLFDILENNKKLSYHQSTKMQDGADTDGDSLMGDIIEKPLSMPVAQIVGAGLKGLFELIAEARNVSPKLCTKGLRALFDVIQGQIPESFKTEPNDLIQPLYDLLLNLATLQSGAAANADLSNWSSIACSALLGLCVARGDTGKTLKAIAALIMSSKILSAQLIQLPLVLSTLQRSIYSVALGKPIKPDFYQNGVPKTALIEEFYVRTQIPEQVQYHLQPSIASNGRYLYILFGKCLFKMGTGFNGTLKGYIYGVNTEFGKNGWIGFCGVSRGIPCGRWNDFSFSFLLFSYRIRYITKKYRNEVLNQFTSSIRKHSRSIVSHAHASIEFYKGEFNNLSFFLFSCCPNIHSVNEGQSKFNSIFGW